MSNLDVTVLGAGDTFSEHHRSSALLLESAGFHLGVDCPDLYRAVLREAGERSGRSLALAQIDDILITHVHGDHMNGLEGVAFYKHFVEGKRLRLHTSPEVRAVIWEQRLQASMQFLWNGESRRELRFEDYFDYIPLRWDEPNAIGPFRISTRRTIHHVPTSALRVEVAGKRLSYSSDTAYDPELLRFLEPSDLVIHETNLGPAHTPYAQLAELPEALRARMRLIHYPDALASSPTTLRLLNEGDRLEL